MHRAKNCLTPLSNKSMANRHTQANGNTDTHGHTDSGATVISSAIAELKNARHPPYQANETPFHAAYTQPPEVLIRLYEPCT